MTVTIFMSRTRILTALIVMLLTSVYCRDVSGQTGTRTAPPAVPRRDTQQWNDVQLIVPVTSKVDFILLGTLQFGRNLSRPVDERIGSCGPIPSQKTRLRSEMRSDSGCQDLLRRMKLS